MSTISRSLPPSLQEAMPHVRTSLGLKVRQTDAYVRQKQLADGLTNGTQPCQRIGNYDAVQLVEGQLAIIYLGRDFMSGQFVALKGPSEYFGNGRIDHEANMLQHIQFPGIVKRLGLIEGPATPLTTTPHYLVEEFIFGVLASDLSLSYPEKIYIMLEAVNTLKDIHEAGLTHQNHWQGNVIVSDSGSLTTIDFNCCQLSSDFATPKEFAEKKRLDQFWLAKRMQMLFGLQEQTYPAAQLLNRIGREVAEGESSPYPFNTCDEFLDAIYEALQRTA
jgi:serine/threonine protein kinase